MENKLAKQSNRRIEIGWLHYESVERCFKQVRPVKGGGTKHLTTPIDATIQSLLELAIDIFFPNGVSQYGKLSNFEFTMVNFDGSPLPMTDTVETVYRTKKVKMLRLYLSTKGRNVDKDDDEQLEEAGNVDNSDDSLPDISVSCAASEESVRSVSANDQSTSEIATPSVCVLFCTNCHLITCFTLY